MRNRKDLAQVGSQIFCVFHEQGVALLVRKRLINSQRAPHVGLPFGGILDVSSFRPLMRG